MKTEKLDFYRSKLAKIEGKEDSFVIFTDTMTKKFIQFVSGIEGGFFADVPVKELTEKEIDKLEKLLGLHVSEVESKAIAEKNYSFNKECALEEATDLTRRFFEDVCGLPEDHDVSVELYSGKVKCALCGKTFKERETEHIEISVDKARELGISEEAIQKNIDEEVRFAKTQEPENAEIKLELDDLKKIVHERGTMFITVCSNCSNSYNLRD